MIRLLMALGISVAVGMLALGAGLLVDARQDAWQQAERSSANLVHALQRDIERNFAIYDLSLLGTIDALRQPGLADVTPAIRQSAIFDRAISAEYLGSLVVLNSAGDIVYDSTSASPHALNLADREYFKVHRDNPGQGLFLSKPFISRLRNNDASVAISRRISGPSGEFDGVVVGGVRLAYFDHLFKGLDLGKDGSVVLVEDDGHIAMRYPRFDGNVDQDHSQTPVIRTILSSDEGHTVNKSVTDGVERLVEYRRIGKLPLHVAVGVSVDEVLASWWRKALVIGGMLAALAASSVVMCLLFRRELSRRLQAEARLTNAARRLELAASTDSLTGLANRRAFQERLDIAWRTASRSGAVLSLLMIDVDCFKLFNDRYGHQEGDRALQAVGQAIGSSLRRAGDLAARYGGEEFAVLLPDTELGGAVAIAERIRAQVRAAAIPHLGGPDGFVTVSIGASSELPIHNERDRILVRTADAALYDAKHAGKNRVCVRTAATSVAALAVPADWTGTLSPQLAGS